MKHWRRPMLSATCCARKLELLGASFKTEDEFLRGTLEFLDTILADPEEYLESWNLLGDTNTQSFVEGIRVVRNHVSATLNTPAAQRGKPPFEEP